MEKVIPITKTEDALKFIRDISSKLKSGDKTAGFINHDSLNPQSFFTDIWYRGEPEIYSTPLTPKIFRKNYDESTIFSYLPTYINELRQIDNDFDRLSYMQHYGVPTRLLDWTDNILVALYFAVSMSPDKDGVVYVLNSRLLNKYTSLRKGYKNILNKDDLGSKFRSLMTHSDSYPEWLDKTARELNGQEFDWTRPDLNQIPIKEVFKLHIDSVKRNEQLQVQIFSTPVAVRPDKSNNRIMQQSGLFTLHGGKNNHASEDTEFNIPIPKTMIELAEERDFLIELRIPHSCKNNIKEDLLFLQIHEGRMYPELEKQHEFIEIIGLKSY